MKKKHIYYSINQEPFKTIDVHNPFFNSFKKIYPEFEAWFETKQITNQNAFIIRAPFGSILAFAYFKNECEGLILDYEQCYPFDSRLKIGSLKVDTVLAGRHLYHKLLEKHAFRLAKATNVNSIYVTLFDKCKELVEILESYGFKKIGTIKGESVYIIDTIDLPE